MDEWLAKSGALAEALETALTAMWPRRSQRELLLDLGERKGWTAQDQRLRVEEVAGWFVDELLLPGEVGFEPLVAPDLSRLRKLDFGESPGVARWIASLAPAVGVHAKTLANSLRGGTHPQRPDHRWVRLAARLHADPPPLDATLYHRLHPAVLAQQFPRWACPAVLDAADATLLFSLLALWQRRRPTAQARANRGRPDSRRHTPKPIAAMSGLLISPGQLRPMAALAETLGSTLLLLAIEAAMTEAHNAPHPARRGEGRSERAGEQWMAVVEELLGTHGKMLGEHAWAFRFRLERMRAWRAGRPQQNSSPEAVRLPYACASLALEAARSSPPSEEPIDPHTPGLLMLLPLLRSRGFRFSR